MRHRRWDLAAEVNKATPTPLYPFPNAYDMKLRFKKEGNFTRLFMGPITPKQPSDQIPFDNYVIWWTAQVQSQPITDVATVMSYLITSKGKRTVKIDWRKGSTVLSTTFYDIVI